MATSDTIHISVVVDVPSGTTGGLDPSQVSFSVDKPTIHLGTPVHGGHADHNVTFVLSGVFNDGVSIDPRLCKLYPEGITWYSSDLVDEKNPWLRPGQLTALHNWLEDPDNIPSVMGDGRSATLQIDRSAVVGFLAQGETLKLPWGIHMQIARDDPSPWCEIHHDPEVDLEMDE